jgi:polyether ionophore transport system permease protein
MAQTTEPSRPERLVAGLAWRECRRGALIWGAAFAFTIVASVLAYRSTYGTAAERAKLLSGLAANSGLRALFGQARGIDTVAGFTAWRTMGLLPLVAGVWGLLAATRLLRGEEESGRWDTLLAGPLTRSRATLASLAGVGAGTLALLVPSAAALLLVGVLPGDVDLGGALWLALALCVAAPAFAAVGALAAQVMASRREAAALAGAVFTAAFVVRAAADASATLGWLRWLTPLGWIEQLRPLTGDRLLPLLPLVGWTVALIALAAWIAGRRDTGAALLRHSDERAPRHVLLGSPGTFAIRESLGGVIGWSLGLGLTAFVYGFLTKAVANLARDSAGLRKHVESSVGARVDILSAKGYLAVVFVFLAIALALYGASHATAAREEEASGRLETLLARPVGRRRWLVERMLAALACCAIIATLMALAAWAGAAVHGGDVTLGAMLRASLNALPVVVLFLGVAFLGLAFVPRHTGAVAFGAVGGAYLWEQVGALVRAPGWTLAPSPFHWLALVPAKPFDVVASVALLGIGVAAAAVAVARFRARDLVSA